MYSSCRLCLLLVLLLCSPGCRQSADGDQGSPAVVRTDLPPTLGALSERVEQADQASPDRDDWQLPDPQAEPEHPPWLRLFYSQDTRGELDPCGCPGSPSGGMARRTTLVRKLRRLIPEAVVVEGPTCLSRAVLGTEVIRGEHRARARLLLQLVAETRPEAFFPGNADFEVVEPVELADLAAEFELPLVATNLSPNLAGGRYRRYLVAEAGERRVVLLGLVGAADNEGVRSKVPTVDAGEAVDAALAAARAEVGRVDLVVAFTDAGVRDLSRWWERGLDVDVVLSPPVRGEGSAPSWRDGKLWLKSEPLGRALGRLDLVFAPGVERSLLRQRDSEWALRQIASMEELYLGRQQVLAALEARVAQGGASPQAPSAGLDGSPRFDPLQNPDLVRRGLADTKATRAAAVRALGEMKLAGHLAIATMVLVDPKLDEDAAVKTRLEDFHGGQLAKLASDLEASAPAPAGEEYAGQDACIACHAEEVAHWARGPHAQAWLHLTQRGETRNTRCLGCHTTGFAEPGGFVDAQQDSSLLNVQCEACHGPMQLHAKQAGRMGVRPSQGLPISTSTCTRCHDAENSPRFECRSYVQRVAHPGAGAEIDTTLARICR